MLPNVVVRAGDVAKWLIRDRNFLGHGMLAPASGKPAQVHGTQAQGHDEEQGCRNEGCRSRWPRPRSRNKRRPRGMWLSVFCRPEAGRGTTLWWRNRRAIRDGRSRQPRDIFLNWWLVQTCVIRCVKLTRIEIFLICCIFAPFQSKLVHCVLRSSSERLNK